MKKTIGILLALILAIGILPLTASAETDGDYTYDVVDGEATLTGYTGAGGDISIPAVLGGYPVKTIDHMVFMSNESVTSIIIPDGVQTIRNHVFRDCSNLESVTIPESVTSIGFNALSLCGKLMSVILPSGLTIISHGLFSGCRALESVNIPNGVKIIDVAAFANCESLTSITIPESVENIGIGAFSGCRKLASITIPEGVKTIDEGAFNHCNSLTGNVVIPKSVTSIGNDAFMTDRVTFSCYAKTAGQAYAKKTMTSYSLIDGTGADKLVCSFDNFFFKFYYTMLNIFYFFALG